MFSLIFVVFQLQNCVHSTSGIIKSPGTDYLTTILKALWKTDRFSTSLPFSHHVVGRTVVKLVTFVTAWSWRRLQHHQIIRVPVIAFAQKGFYPPLIRLRSERFLFRKVSLQAEKSGTTCERAAPSVILLIFKLLITKVRIEPGENTIVTRKN